MTTGKLRLEKLESSLQPKQAFLLWMQEAHRYDNITEYLAAMRDHPEEVTTLQQLRERVEQGASSALKGQPKQKVMMAVRQAVRDVAFLFNVHYQINAQVVFHIFSWQLMSNMLQTQLMSMLKEDAFHNFLQDIIERIDEEREEYSGGSSSPQTKLVKRQSGSSSQQIDDLRFLNKMHGIKLDLLKDWKEAAQGLIGELYVSREAITAICQHYFEGRQGLFPYYTVDLDNLIEEMEKLVDKYNQRLKEKDKTLGDIDITRIRQNGRKEIVQRTSYILDMARADTLSFRGEDQAALELMDKYW